MIDKSDTRRLSPGGSHLFFFSDPPTTKREFELAEGRNQHSGGCKRVGHRDGAEYRELLIAKDEAGNGEKGEEGEQERSDSDRG